MTFATLFTLDVTHGYYGGPCPDVGFVLPADTIRRLRNGRLLARTMTGRLTVLFEMAESGTGPMTPLTGQTLRIGLIRLNPALSNITAEILPSASAIAVFRNGSSATALDAPLAAHPASQAFTHPVTDTARPVSVSVTGPSGALLSTETLAGSDPRATVSIDLAGRAAGLYTIGEAYPATTASTQYYLDPELLAEPVLAVIEIAIAPGFYAAPPAFQVALNARQETLNYYVIARDHTSAEFGQLLVSDEGFTDEARPRITFNRIESSAFTSGELPAALLGNGDVRIALFRSAGPVARTARGRQRIQLRRSNAVIVANLPQPGPERATADMIVHVSKRP
jgi:hypothetical protein